MDLPPQPFAWDDGMATFLRKKLVLVPGLLCDRTIWREQLSALGDVADMIVADLRHHDDISAMAAAVLAATTGRVSVAGHSMGGRVALEMIRQSPERIDRLALLDTGVHPVREGEVTSRGALVALGHAQGMAAVADRWLPPMLAADGAGSAALVMDLRAMVLSMTPAIFERQQRALLRRPDVASLLPSIRCPVLVGVGSEDRWSSPRQHAAFAARIPGAELVLFEGGGHMAPVEKPAQVNAALRRWLETPEGP